MKPKENKSKDVSSNQSDDEWLSEDDEALLHDVDDNDDECDLEIEEDGSDIDSSEISSIITKLGLNKYNVIIEKDEKIDTPKEKDENEVSEDKSEAKTKNKNKKLNERSKDLSDSDNNQQVLDFLKINKTRKYLLIKPGEMWRDETAREVQNSSPDDAVVKEAEKLAQRLITDEINVYTKQKENQKRSEANWLKTVLNSGTLSDKMAALTLLIQESPIHNTNSIDTLISMSGKKGRREAMMATDTLRDLLITGLLPDDRKLKLFHQQPLHDLKNICGDNIETRDQLLVMWHFENYLKKKYSEFIKALGEMSFDTLQTTKEKALSTIHHLLTSKPEQENTLLPMLVNKIGDPSIKAKTTYLIIKLFEEHPNMKTVIVREIQQLLYRPNVSQRAQYYAICLLSQVRLDREQSNLANQLLKIYFSFFQTYLKKSEVDNKMMSALLTGVNRAYVFAKDKRDDIASMIDAIYKIIPTSSFHTSVQALMLLYQVTDTGTSISDRYYTCLYKKLVDPGLQNSAKQAIFMNLVFKSLKRDLVDKRVKAFLKRILQVYSQQTPNVISGILILLSQIVKERPNLLNVNKTKQSAWEEDNEEEKFVDLPIPDEFKSDKDDSDHNENSGIQNGGAQNEMEDIKPIKSSWVHRRNFGEEGRSSGYDPYHRNPIYAHAEVDCIWEMKELSSHYHPTVKLYADSLLQGKPIDYDGDPLKDFTLIRFLDKFVYKNPKKSLEKQPFSLMSNKPKSVETLAVNSNEFIQMGEKGVALEDKFFYRFFAEKAKKAKQVKQYESDGDSVDDDEFDNYLDGFEKEVDNDYLFNLDFAGDKNRKKHNQNNMDEEEESEVDEGSDDDDDEDLEDENLAAEFNRELENLHDSSDEEAPLTSDGFVDEDQLEQMDLSSDEDDELKSMMKGAPSKKSKKRKAQSIDNLTKKPKSHKKDITDLFASAEEFSHLLEENTESGKVSLGGTDDVRVKDKAAQKQLKWEVDRHRKLEWKSGKGKNSKSKFKPKAKGKFKRETGQPGKKNFTKQKQRQSKGKRR